MTNWARCRTGAFGDAACCCIEALRESARCRGCFTMLYRKSVQCLLYAPRAVIVLHFLSVSCRSAASSHVAHKRSCWIARWLACTKTFARIFSIYIYTCICSYIHGYHDGDGSCEGSAHGENPWNRSINVLAYIGTKDLRMSWHLLSPLDGVIDLAIPTPVPQPEELVYATLLRVALQCVFAFEDHCVPVL